MPRQKNDRKNETVRRMVHNYLQASARVTGSLTAADAPAIASRHLDEDALSAFVEGRLAEREAAPFVAHLIGCAACRHITARLVRLQAETSDTVMAVGSEQSFHEEPGRVRRLLDDLASRLSFVSGEESVFAYHAPADDFEDARREREVNEPKSEPGEDAKKEASHEEPHQK